MGAYLYKRYKDGQTEVIYDGPDLDNNEIDEDGLIKDDLDDESELNSQLSKEDEVKDEEEK